MPFFKVGMQQRDVEGTVAADYVAQRSVHNIFKANGLIQDNEFIVGLEFLFSEHHGGPVDQVNIKALILPYASNFEEAHAAINETSGPIDVITRDLSMSVNDFFGLFKRFKMTFSPRGIKAIGREYRPA